jgi:hypothetical protein
VHTAYEQLAQFECYPQFMTGVQEVRQVSDTTTHWIMDLDGRRTEFDAQITDCTLDQRVAWQATGNPKFAEAITLKPVGADRTQVIAELEADAKALLPSDAHAQESLSRRLKADLDGFKRYVEQQAGTQTSKGRMATPSLLGRSKARSAAGGDEAAAGAQLGSALSPDLGLGTQEGSADLRRGSGRLSGSIPSDTPQASGIDTGSESGSAGKSARRRHGGGQS